VLETMADLRSVLDDAPGPVYPAFVDVSATEIPSFQDVRKLEMFTENIQGLFSKDGHNCV
jgi:hypothetical protein